MRLDGVALLAAPTTRSQAYLQALVANELQPDHVIAMGDLAAPDPTDAASQKRWKGIALPDLGESLLTTCKRAGIPVVACGAVNVNAAEVLLAVRGIAPRLVIYSGYGGQIIGDEMLDSGPRFLHLHSGWLPEYRGSTTLYYALLHGEYPGVTAIILDRNIDTGPMVARRHYPKPGPDLDIDRVYDAAIRADLLVQVMATYAQDGHLPSLEQQTTEKAVNYYVIHPVLKHIAILALDGGAQ
jgi:methionyl-tRNA formyltransferase